MTSVQITAYTAMGQLHYTVSAIYGHRPAGHRIVPIARRAVNVDLGPRLDDAVDLLAYLCEDLVDVVQGLSEVGRAVGKLEPLDDGE